MIFYISYTFSSFANITYRLPLPYKNVKAETHLIAMASTQHDTDEVTKEARKKKIRELEASLFGNTLDEDGSSWNPR